MGKYQELVKIGDELDTPFVEGDTKIKRLALWLMQREKQCEENGPAYEYNANDELIEIPSSRSLRERVEEWRLKEKGSKFYAIAAPEKRVCTSWDECKPFVVGVKGVVYKSFGTREEAEESIENPVIKMDPEKEAARAAKKEAKAIEKEAKDAEKAAEKNGKQ